MGTERSWGVLSILKSLGVLLSPRVICKREKVKNKKCPKRKEIYIFAINPFLPPDYLISDAYTVTAHILSTLITVLVSIKVTQFTPFSLSCVKSLINQKFFYI